MTTSPSKSVGYFERLLERQEKRITDLESQLAQANREHERIRAQYAKWQKESEETE